MKFLHNILGILCAFCVMIIFLITAVEAVTYWTPGYYEMEYTKYNVTADVNMQMSDLLAVTDEMMSYLRGNREDLHVWTVVGGQEREFFNEREIAHMEDVRELFLASISLRRYCFWIIAGCILLMIFTKAKLRLVLPKTLCIGTGVFFAIAAAVAAIISTDFSKYFIVFHEIFFSNDLWILDPRTDLLINIVPEPFFFDTTLRIGLTFAMMTVLLLLFCFFLLFKQKKNKYLNN